MFYNQLFNKRLSNLQISILAVSTYLIYACNYADWEVTQFLPKCPVKLTKTEKCSINDAETI